MEVREGYKQSEVGVIPEDWEITSLNNITTLITKGTTPSGFSKTGVLYIKIESLKGDKVDRKKCLFIEPSIHNNELKRSILEENDLLFAIAGATIGKCTFVTKDLIPSNTNQALSIIRLKDKDLMQFVFISLKSQLMRNYILDNISVGAQPNLNLEQIGNFSFPLPPTLEEQKAIAIALSDVDNLITNLDDLIAKKKAIKQGAMQQLLTPPSKGGKRLDGFDGEWVEMELQELCEVKGGGTPSTQISYYWNGSINWFTPTEIGNNKYVSQSKRRISNLGLKSSSAQILPKNSILLTTRASIGDVAILKNEACTNQGFQSLVPKDFRDSEFIFQLIQLKKNDLIMLSSGSTFLEVSPKKVKALIIEVPHSIIARNSIATILSDMDEELEELTTKKEKYEHIKQGMMQELLTGKTRLV